MAKKASPAKEKITKDRISSAKKQAEVGKVMEMANKKKKQMVFSTISTTIISIVGFGILGWVIDMVADTKPVFLIVCLAISFPATQFNLYKEMLKITKQ